MSVVTLSSPAHTNPYSHISTRFDSQHGALWCFLDPKPRACFTFEVLDELRRFQQVLERLVDADEGERARVRYVILASKTPGIFNFGGDLSLFIQCITNRDAITLRRYAKACIDVLYPHAIGFHLPLTTISLVQGDALGGGFEAALASDIIIAEHNAQMGFPEVLFNLFPGMGAYNLLQRRVGMLRTEKMLLNGKLYSAKQLHEEGVVDILAENGRGENAVYEYILRQSARRNAHEAILRVRRKLQAVSYEQLLEVVEVWINTALQITPREIRMMDRLMKAQGRNSQQVIRSPFASRHR